MTLAMFVGIFGTLLAVYLLWADFNGRRVNKD